ncbi:MAG: hypothetical protein WCX28_06230 [Bacteriovoracaceae bacterium]
MTFTVTVTSSTNGIANVTAKFSGKINASRSFVINTSNGQNDPGMQEYIAWATEQYQKYLSGGMLSSVATPTNPAIRAGANQLTSSIRNFSARPKASSQKEKEEESSSKETARRPTRALNSDVAYETFSIGSTKGDNLGTSGNLFFSNDVGDNTFGISFDYNDLIFGNSASVISGTGNLVLKKNGIDEATGEVNPGAAEHTLMLSYTGVEKQVAAYAFSWSMVWKNSSSTGTRFAFGTMIGASTMSPFIYGNYGLAMLVGLPLGDRAAWNVDFVYVGSQYTKLGDIESGEQSSFSMSSLTAGSNVDIMMSDAFGLNIGVRKTFLVKEYSNMTYVLGSRIGF